MSMTLAEFLLARIAEDEAACRPFIPDAAKWGTADGQWVTSSEKSGEQVRAMSGAAVARGSSEAVAYIARNDPRRVLVECEAKRRIVEAHAGAHECPTEDSNCGWAEDESCYTLRILAAVYADHEQFQEEWRP